LSKVKMPFGKYKGKTLDQIPPDYLDWVLREAESASPFLKDAIRRHLYGGPEPEPGPRPEPEAKATQGVTDMKAIVKRWYAELVMRYHPDRGGEHAVMVALNDAHARLKRLAGLE
jgi:hypothetical protein